jgi:hypothetical protein
MWSFRNFVLGTAISISAMSAQAAPVQFTFTSTITNSFADPEISGVSTGDLVTIKILADNGGSDLLSQTWTITDLISGSASAGSYTQSYIDGWFDDSGIVFQTNASGNLTLTAFYGTTDSPNHQDSFGTGPDIYLFSDSLRDFYGNYADFGDSLGTLANWTVSQVTPVPEPDVAFLMALGLIGAMSLRHKVKA